jgi:hypothetical protein
MNGQTFIAVISQCHHEATLDQMAKLLEELATEAAES